VSGRTISAALRSRVRRRARDRCEYCLYPQRACYARFHCDHFVPISGGGLPTFDNLIWACPACNASKQARQFVSDPRTGIRAPLFNPRRERWTEHFRWSADMLRIVGLTPTGRATIRALRMNRRGVTVIRAMLLELDLHPAQG
jgi:hypothetical protein